jgi:hypothetical protein
MKNLYLSLHTKKPKWFCLLPVILLVSFAFQGYALQKIDNPTPEGKNHSINIDNAGTFKSKPILNREKRELRAFIASSPSGQLGYVWNADSGQGFSTGLGSLDLGNGQFNLIHPIGSGDFLAGGDFVGDKYVGIEYNSKSIVEVDLITGNKSVFITPASANLFSGSATSLAYDSQNNTLYVVTVSSASYLYKIDLDAATPTVEMIGNYINGANLIIGIAFDNNGNLFGIDLMSDALYSIDTNTAVATSIGSLGIDINYAQDIAYDRVNGILYGTLYSNSGQFGSINTQTGLFTPVALLPIEGTAFGIPYVPQVVCNDFQIQSTLISDYSFNGDANDSKGNTMLDFFPPTTTSSGHNNSTLMYGSDGAGSFLNWSSTASRGGGFSMDLDPAYNVGDGYTFYMKFSFAATSGYRKIIDFENLTSDFGLYLLGGSLVFYSISNELSVPIPVVQPNEIVELIINRDPLTKVFTASYRINCVVTPLISFTDTNDRTILSSVSQGGNRRIRFFHDDTQTGGEATPSGKIYELKVFGDPANELQVADITINSANLLVTSFQTGDGYYVVVPRGSDAPTAQQVKAGVDYGTVSVLANGQGAITAGNEQSYPIMGLTTDFDYDVYFVVESGSVFTSVDKIEFSTLTCEGPQIDALKALYESLNGDNWAWTDPSKSWKDSNGNWRRFNNNGVNWEGVVMNDCDILSIDLSGKTLTGHLPNNIGDLTALTSLKLGENNIIGKIPESIKNLNLTEFTIGYNGVYTDDPTVKAFIDQFDSGWDLTQTLPPVGLMAELLNPSAIISWTPIVYQGGTGRYFIKYRAEDEGGFQRITVEGKNSSEGLIPNL